MEDFTIDRKSKSFVFDDGEVIPIPKDKQKQVLRSKAAQKSKQEAIEKWQDWQGNVPIGEAGHALVNSASENLFGNLGDTLANYAVSGIKSFSPGEGQEEMGYVDRVLDHFYAMQEGRKESLAGLQERNPVSSTIGKGLGVAGELGTLYGVPGVAALPLMGAGSSETSFLEPAEKLKEVLPQAIEGKILDKFFGSLSKIAGNRETRRELKDLITNTERSNAAELQKAASATEAEQLRFAQQNAAREAELQGLPALQEAENKLFQEAGNKASERISRTVGKQGIAPEALGVEEFIETAIGVSPHAASSEANYATKFLRSVFKGDKNGKITGEGLKKGMNALDEVILKSEGAIKEILTEYKTFLSKTLPEKLSVSYATEKWMPKLSKPIEQIDSNLFKIFEKMDNVKPSFTRSLGKDYAKEFSADVKNALNNSLDLANLDPSTIKERLANSIRETPSYKKMFAKVNDMYPNLSKKVVFNVPEYKQLYTSLETYPEILAERISKNVEKYYPDIQLDVGTKSGVARSALEKAPVSPNMIAPPAAVSPAQRISPNLAEVPVMPEPQGIYGKLAAGLEGLRDMGPGELFNFGKNSAPTALIAKMAGFPLAKAGLGAAGIATGLRGLTSPSSAGKFLRGSLGQGARTNVEKIDALAQKYPSYANGVVELPQHRRSLTKEIENLSDLSLEEKAIFQSKINRGKPLNEKL